MSHSHSHNCGHHHHHGHGHLSKDARLTWAVVLNVGLTFAQIVGGILSGSLALIAEAVHNFSDAATLLIALAAQKIARRKPDAKRTYGYRKVETLSAYTNFLSLILLSLWLAGEAIGRLLNPEPVGGLTVIIISGIAFVINMITVGLMLRDSKTSHNVRAAFLHNLADSLSSLGVIIAGFIILQTGWNWIDPLITLFISAYIIWHACHDMPSVVNILIDGAPDHLNLDHIMAEMAAVTGVASIHHLHIRRLDEHRTALESHVVVDEGANSDQVRDGIRGVLAKFHIEHSSLEIETKDCGLPDCQ